MKKLRSVELFSGAGGLALATHSAGFHHRALVEFNADACETLRANSADGKIPGIEEWDVRQADVRQVTFKEFDDLDLVAGGPPCQPFSIGGRHRGYEDPRDMIPQFIRCVRETAPKAFILENVKGLTRKSFATYLSHSLLQLSYPLITRKPKESWDEHLGRLERQHTKGGPTGLKYNVVFRVLNAADYGVPQARERVFIVGVRSDLGVEWRFPTPTHSQDALLWDQWVSGSYWDRNSVECRPPLPERFRGRVDRLRSQPLAPPVERPWRTVREAIIDLPSPSLGAKESVPNHRFQPGARPYKGHTGSPLDLPAKTLKAGDHGVPGGENMMVFSSGETRYFSVREAARVQTFPDEWRFMGAWSEAMRQLGNAVPVGLAGAVANSLARKLQPHA